MTYKFNLYSIKNEDAIPLIGSQQKLWLES